MPTCLKNHLTFPFRGEGHAAWNHFRQLRQAQFRDDRLHLPEEETFWDFVEEAEAVLAQNFRWGTPQFGPVTRCPCSLNPDTWTSSALRLASRSLGKRRVASQTTASMELWPLCTSGASENTPKASRKPRKAWRPFPFRKRSYPFLHFNVRKRPYGSSACRLDLGFAAPGQGPC